MKLMRVITLAAFALAPALPAAPDVRAQACGVSFVDIEVVDSKGHSVPGATIEIVADAPESYAPSPWPEGGVVLSLGNNPAIKISLREAEEIIELGVPRRRSIDNCGNPLKQVANSTKVARHPGYGHAQEFSVKNFGFCTTELYEIPSLLKVSAPGYVTDYYLGVHLGGCQRSYKIVLTKAGGKSQDRRANT